MKKFITKYYFLILPLIVTAIMLLQNIAYYQVDDRLMMEMANSFKTNPHSEHIMFINVVFGYGLKFLYGIFSCNKLVCRYVHCHRKPCLYPTVQNHPEL